MMSADSIYFKLHTSTLLLSAYHVRSAAVRLLITSPESLHSILQSTASPLCDDMRPRTVVVSLVLILSTTLWQYMFFIPDSIANDGAISENGGHWSPSTSDFDWCERNYIFSEFIAEPFNSGTSLIYIIVAVLSMSAAKRHLPPSVSNTDLLFLTMILICIGIGSTLFHASLLYDTQLLDEIPMHWLVSYASVMMYTRNDYKVRTEKSRKFTLKTTLTLCAAAFAVTIDILSWITPKETPLHQAVKLIMAITFVAGFVYTFYVSAKLANEILDHDPNDPELQRVNRWFDKVRDAMSCSNHSA